jgi:hypothetical protein
MQPRSGPAAAALALSGKLDTGAKKGQEGPRALFAEPPESTGAEWYAPALYELGRLDEAEEWAQKGRELGGRQDVTTQMLARQVQAKVLARREQHAEADSAAREAMALADATDGLLYQGNVRLDFAEVLELAGRREEATAALHEALERYQQKGALAPADRVRERLAALDAAASA